VTDKQASRAPIFGPEDWSEVAGAAWSHWDRWYSAVCVADFGGDWAAMAERLATRSGRLHIGSDAEAKLSHLDGLAERLAAEDDPALLLAARRAVLTVVQQVAHHADDSFGLIGELGEAAWSAYVATAWRDLNPAGGVLT
jgi:hypothetical protein